MRYMQFMSMAVFAGIGSVSSAPMAGPSSACSLGEIRLESSMNFIQLKAEPGKCFNRRSGETKYFVLTASGSESLQIFVSTIQDGRYFEADGIVDLRQDPGESDSYRIVFTPHGEGTFTTAIPVVYGYSDTALRGYRDCIEQRLSKPIEGWKNAIFKIEMEPIDYSAVTVRIEQLALKHTEQLKPWMSRIEEAKEKVVALIDEKSKTIEELKNGFFCSECGRSKTQIEKSGEVFERHLQSVGGKRVPATPEQIAAKEKEYDEKIDKARSKVNWRRMEYDRESERLRQLRVVQEQRERKDLEKARERVLEQLRRKLEYAEQAYEQGIRGYDRKVAERKTLMIRVEGVCKHE